MSSKTEIKHRHIFVDGHSYGDVMGAVSKEPSYRSASIRETINLIYEHPSLKQSMVSTGDGIATSTNRYGESFLKVDLHSTCLSEITDSTRHASSAYHMTEQTYADINSPEISKKGISAAALTKRQAKKNPLLIDLLGNEFLKSLVTGVYSGNGKIQLHLGGVPDMKPSIILRPVSIKADGSNIEIYADLDLSRSTIMPTILNTPSSEISRFVI